MVPPTAEKQRFSQAALPDSEDSEFAKKWRPAKKMIDLNLKI